MLGFIGVGIANLSGPRDVAIANCKRKMIKSKSERGERKGWKQAERERERESERERERERERDRER